jgi:DNA-binding IclR family transcriptional regulator
MARLDFDNLVSLEQTVVAEKLGMHKQSVNRSIKRLVELGCLLEGPKIGRSRTYRLNPSYGWKGSSKNHHETLRTDEKARMAGFPVLVSGHGT